MTRSSSSTAFGSGSGHSFDLVEDVDNRLLLLRLHLAECPADVLLLALLDFAQSVYDAASTLGKWDRDSLEESNLHPPKPLP